MIKRVLLLLYAVIAVAFGLNSSDAEEYSEVEWMCMQVDSWKTLIYWKEQVEKQCDVSDVQEDWQSLFKCPDFSEVKCPDEISRYSETVEYNCTFVFCANGRYFQNKKVLQKIYRDNVDAHKKIMEFYKNELMDCRPRCTKSGIDDTSTTKATTASQVITEVITNSESTTDVVTSSSATETSITTDVTTAPELITASVIPIGWETSGSLYYKCFTHETVDYATAKANCGSYGGRLAAKVLRDPVAVKNIISKGYIGDNWKTGEVPWVGFDDLSKEGEWEWVDGGNMNPNTTVWRATEPSNSHGSEHCGHIIEVTDGRLAINDNVCSYPLRYICEIETGV